MNITEKAAMCLEHLVQYGVSKQMMSSWDIPQVRNQLLALLEIPAPYEGDVLTQLSDHPFDLLKELLDFAVSTGLISSTITERDLLDAKIMAQLMPRQSELIEKFQHIELTQGKEAATDYFYALSQNSNYIRMDRISKNQHWLSSTEFGDLEITINLSKPEKDPAEIAAEKNTPMSNYPKCLLCIDNVGYAGRLNHPGRSNHRVIPITLDQEQWYLQYSPYVYYNEHAIVFSESHRPMTISKKTFERLLDFVALYPHYFVGSNADLPIVGGSILSHDHFQGGHHIFPMEHAQVLKEFKHPTYTDLTLQMLKWPLSVIRLVSKNPEVLIDMADHILELWRNFSNEEAEIHAFTDATPHNTITPIARCNADGFFEVDLTLRNNRTSEVHPGGLFHPHEHLHHIKKENIGLIEVMGLAVLPSRLKEELEMIKKVLTGEVPLKDALSEEDLKKHEAWIMTLMDQHGSALTSQEASVVLQAAVGAKFCQVLECSGVFKQNATGLAYFESFIQHCITPN